VKGDTLYVAVNLGRFNTETKGNSFVYSYDARTLEQKKTWKLDMPMGAGGMTWKGDRFYVVGGLPPTHSRNYVHEYDADFRLVKRHVLETGYTVLGIQTAAFMDGEFLFGIYGGGGNPSGLLRCSADFKRIRRYTGNGAVGFARIGGRIYTGFTGGKKESGWTGGLNLSEGLLQDGNLFSNPWYEKGVYKDVLVNAAKIEIGTAKGGVNFAFDDSWRKRIKDLAAKGHNAVFIDFADGYSYSCNAEASAKGAWTPEQVKKAMKIVWSEGMEPLPYMDFTAPRNSWLGAENLPSASKKSLALCCGMIKELAGAFGRSRYFKIKTDGLPEDVAKELNGAIVNNGYGCCPCPF
jgi:hypothetical protein